MNESIDKKAVQEEISTKSRHKKWVFASFATFQIPSSLMGAVQGGQYL